MYTPGDFVALCGRAFVLTMEIKCHARSKVPPQDLATQSPQSPSFPPLRALGWAGPLEPFWRLARLGFSHSVPSLGRVAHCSLRNGIQDLAWERCRATYGAGTGLHFSAIPETKAL